MQDLRAAAADAMAIAALPGAIGLEKGQITLDGLPLPHSTACLSQPPGVLRVTAEHMERALLGVKRRTATALGAPSVPKVREPSPCEALLRAIACFAWSMPRKIASGPAHNRHLLTLQSRVKGLLGILGVVRAQAWTLPSMAHRVHLGRVSGVYVKGACLFQLSFWLHMLLATDL